MKKPHIIILNPDEMRWNTMGHMGNPAAITPNLDAFAKEDAVSFSQAFCQNPVCVPSRCSFFTGLYPHTKGHRTMSYLLHEDETSLFSELKDAGYYVWMNARNDLVAAQKPGLVERHASEIFYEKEGSLPKTQVNLPQTQGDGHPYSHFQGLRSQAGDRDWEDTEAACERILNLVEPEKPLCLFLGWMNPHTPYAAEDPYYHMIDRSKVPPRIRFEDTTNKSLMVHKIHEYVQLDDYTEEQWTELRATYLAQCTKIDRMFEMVCGALKKAGMYEDSAIFVLSDHGDYCGDYGLPEKAQSSFEDVITRVPFLVKPPKGYEVDPGISDSLVELVDFYATAMEYAGVAPTHDHFGKSVQPIVANRSVSLRDYVHCEGGRNANEYQCDEWHENGEEGPNPRQVYYPKKKAQYDNEAHEKATMVRDHQYKYVHRSSGACEFYDLTKDPGECHNLYPDKCDREIVGKMQMHLLNWYQETCDIVPREYDNRFTAERLLMTAKAFCKEEKDVEAVRQYIREKNPTIFDVVSFARQLHK